MLGKVRKIRPNTARADSHGAARSIQAWPRPLGLRLGDADDVAVAPAHPLADRARLALTPYGAVLGCNRCSTSSTGFASGLHSARSPSQDTRAAGSQSVAHKANLLSGCGKVFSALEAAGWRSRYRAPEYRYCRGHERATDKDGQRRSPRATAATSKLPSDSKARRDRHTEIAGDDGRCVIAQKRAPALITARSAAWLPSYVFAHGARRDSNAELNQQFVRDPLLAP